MRKRRSWKVSKTTEERVVSMMKLYPRIIENLGLDGDTFVYKYLYPDGRVGLAWGNDLSLSLWLDCQYGPMDYISLDIWLKYGHPPMEENLTDRERKLIHGRWKVGGEIALGRLKNEIHITTREWCERHASKMDNENAGVGYREREQSLFLRATQAQRDAYRYAVQTGDEFALRIKRHLARTGRRRAGKYL